ncbi:hypothetical protein [Nocardioides coralli]|uniref:hypothetical protein n=1 Tax=Nocardioides coralli TaxID=2872154 RepID=UPI001CA46AA4|nr:hypothetical protein [Nocardioides coralli]QZY30048.1 hypothetical protein K6T13_05015 [Nocardioides coralli]
MSPRPLYLHVGASKTGTSALQRGLFDSVAALAEQGVGMPLASRDDHVRRVLRPLGWVTAAGFTQDVRRERLAELGPLLASADGERLLLTCEDVCEADPERIAALVQVAEESGHEVRVVLSLRGLAAVIPSEWQQFLKHRMALDYPTFLRRLRERRGRWATHFWQRQDVPEICGRWAEAVGSDRLDVVVTPDRTHDPDGLYRTFGQVVGFDPAALSWPTRNVNASWGYVEAELYRRVNEALGRDRLPRYERDYQPGLRWPLVQGVLPRSASERIPLPTDQLEWVTEVAQGHVAWLRDSEIRVHGDLDRLVPTARDVADLPELDEAAVARAAVDTLANFAEFTWRRHQRATAPAAGRGGMITRARRRLRRRRRQRSL